MAVVQWWSEGVFAVLMVDASSEAKSNTAARAQQDRSRLGD